MNASCIVPFKLRSWVPGFPRVLAPAIVSRDRVVLALVAVAFAFSGRVHHEVLSPLPDFSWLWR